MKQSYRIGRYVSIAYIDATGTQTDPYIPEAEIPWKIVLGHRLIVRPCLHFIHRVDLGIIREARNYKKRQQVDIRTDDGWYRIEFNEPLAWLLTPYGGDSDAFDD